MRARASAPARYPLRAPRRPIGLARRFGAATLRKPVPEIADGVHVIQNNVDTKNVDTPRKRGRPAKADSARSDELPTGARSRPSAKRRLHSMISQAQGYDNNGRPGGVLVGKGRVAFVVG